MNRLLLLLLVPLVFAPAADNAGFPFTDEQLTYSINWPSGLSLGEGKLNSRHTGEGWDLELTLDAAIPGYAVKDSYKSRATAAMCSSYFARNSLHGKKKVDETTSVDFGKKVATRATAGGGKTDIPLTECLKDALSYLFWCRRELGQGRVPSAQPVLFGALYQADFQYAGEAQIAVNDKPTKTDKLLCHLKGPASDIKFEMYVARDAARTPLVFRVPLPMGTFSMEIVR